MEYDFLHFPAGEVHVDRVRFARLPASARRVFESIKAGGPVTGSDLQTELEMPARTVRYAIKRLRDEGFVDSRCSLRDCRTCYFFVHSKCVGVEALDDARQKAAQRA